MTKRSAAHYFLEGLTDIGVDYIFANLGTDHVSLIEKIAPPGQRGAPAPARYTVSPRSGRRSHGEKVDPLELLSKIRTMFGRGLPMAHR